MRVSLTEDNYLDEFMHPATWVFYTGLR